MTPYEGRRVLVTGGAGFVGGALARRLAECGALVSVLDDFSTGQPDSVSAAATLVHGSVTDRRLVHDLVATHPLVFHLAARGIGASIRNPEEDFDTNVGGSVNLLLAARDIGVERFVYSSSASIYGNPRSIPINEDDRLEPISPYAVGKLAAEHYCLAFYENYGVPATALRYSNVFGPGQRSDILYPGVVTRFLSCASGGRPLSIHGDGQQTRDFTFIDDVLDATLLAGSHPRAVGEAFNVGTGIETSVNELARAIARALGMDELEIEHVDRRDIDNIRRRVMNVDKIRRMLRWSPQVTLDAGLRRTADVLLR